MAENLCVGTSVSRPQSSSVTGTTVQTPVPKSQLNKLFKQNRKLQHNSIAFFIRQTNGLMVNELKTHHKKKVRDEIESAKGKTLNKTRIAKIINQHELQFVDHHQPPQLFHTTQSNNIFESRHQSQRDLLKRKILPNATSRPKSASTIVRKVSTPEFQFVEEMGSIRTDILEEYEKNISKYPNLKYNLLEEDYTMADADLRIRQIHPRNINRMYDELLNTSFTGIASLPESQDGGGQNVSNHGSSLTVSIDLKSSLSRVIKNMQHPQCIDALNNTNDFAIRPSMQSEAIFDMDDDVEEEEEGDVVHANNRGRRQSGAAQGLTLQTSNILSQPSNISSAGAGSIGTVLALESVHLEKSVESSLYLNSPMRTAEKRKQVQHVETITRKVTNIY